MPFAEWDQHNLLIPYKYLGSTSPFYIYAFFNIFMSYATLTLKKYLITISEHQGDREAPPCLATNKDWSLV